MRVFKRVLLPAIALLMVMMPLAESVIADQPLPQATPVADDPIAIEGELLPPTINEICGPDNDEIIPADSQPEGVNPQPEISAWQNSQATLTYSALDGYVFPEGMTNTIVVDELDVTEHCGETSHSTADTGELQTSQSVEPIISFGYPESMNNLPYGEYSFTFSYDFTGYVFEEPDSNLIVDYRIIFDTVTGWSTNSLEYNGRVNTSSLPNTARYLAFDCLEGEGTLRAVFRLRVLQRSGSGTHYTHPDYPVEIPCKVETTPIPPAAQVHLCGPNNDNVEIPEQPNGVIVDDPGWVDGERTITYSPASYAFFPEGTQTVFPFIDDASEPSPCIPEGELNPPTVVELCGSNNDEIAPAETQPSGVDPEPVISDWVDNQATLTYSRTDGQAFPEGYGYVITVIDEGDCVTDPPIVPELIDAVCGDDNDIYSDPEQPENVTMTDSGWRYNERFFAFSTAENHKLPDGFGAVHMVTDANNPCIESVTIHVDEGAFLNRQIGALVDIEVTFTIADSHPFDTVAIQPLQNSLISVSIHTPVEPGKGETITVVVPLDIWDWPGSYSNLCPPADNSIELTAWVSGWTDGDRSEIGTWFLIGPLPCSWATDVTPLADISQVEVCGTDNDVLNVAEQPEGVSYTVHEWSNGSTTVEFYPTDETYYFRHDPQTVFPFEDPGDCATDGPEIPELLDAICGDDNDVYSDPEQPVNVTMTDSGWNNNERTFTFETAENHKLPDGFEAVHTVIDEGDCEVVPVVPELLDAVCGDNNDVYTEPEQPVNLTMTDSGWIDNERTFTFSAAENHVLPDDAETEVTFTDEGDCLTDLPIVPELMDAVCGDNNDVYTEPDQPANVLVDDSGWSNNERTFTFSAAENHVLPDAAETEVTFTDEGDCVTDLPIVPELIDAVCGDNNDVYADPEQSANVLVNDSGWINNERTFSFAAAENHVLPDAAETEVTFTDEGDCLTDLPILPELQDAVCGDDNDVYSNPDQPANVLVNDSGWNNNERTFTFSAAENHVLPDDAGTEVTFTDEGDCLTDLPIVPELQDAVCGDDNDVYSEPEQPANVLVNDSGWINNERTFSFSAAENHVLPDDADTEVTFTDEGDCLTDLPIVPDLLDAVCGDDNDVYSDPDQPANVLVNDSGWIDNERTFTFSAAENHVLPDGFARVHTVTDASTPCPTDAPVPPVQSEVCGPNNDIVTIPPQPEGVTLETDTDWQDGSRTIMFAVDPAFETDGETIFDLTDEAIPCPITLTVQLEPSDNGSLEGAAWQLYAPVAAQNVGTEPYAEGTVDAGNNIVINNLIAGEYRLVVNADGYEPIDTVITVTDGEESQIVQLQIAALQPVGTPTPEPTVEPTAEATPIQIPTEEPSAITGLPETGSGSGGGFGILALAGLIAAIGLGAASNRRKHQS